MFVREWHRGIRGSGSLEMDRLVVGLPTSADSSIIAGYLLTTLQQTPKPRFGREG